MEREEVIESTKHFKDMEDDQLLRIIDGIPPEHDNYNGLQRHEAEVELQRRKGRTDKWMLFMTAIILVLTFYLSYKEFTKREPSHVPNPVVDKSNTNQATYDTPNNKQPTNTVVQKSVHSKISSSEK